MTCTYYIADCLRYMGQNKSITISLYEILNGEIKQEMTAKEAEAAIYAEFERLGGVAVGD